MEENTARDPRPAPRRAYAPPEVTAVRLHAEEVMGNACKLNTTAAYNASTCISGSCLTNGS